MKHVSANASVKIVEFRTVFMLINMTIFIFQRIGVIKRNKQPTTDLCDMMVILLYRLVSVITMTFFKILNLRKYLLKY